VTSHLIPSHRARPGNDPIFALSKLAAERKASGLATINATLGVLLDDEGKLATLPTATRALREATPEQLSSYAPIAGTAAFLEAIRRDVSRGDAGLLARAVAVATAGGTGALRHAITTLLEPGEALLTTSYYWGPYATIAAEHGRDVKTFSMFRPDGAFDAAALSGGLRALLTEQGRALVVLNDPCHNPTGYSMSEDDWRRVSEALSEAAAQGPVSIVLDIAYSAFSPGAVERPIRALSGIADRVMVGFCWSASKSFLLYGQRVGALVLVPPDARDMAEVEASLAFSCRGTWSNCNHAGMAAVSRMLTEPELRAAADAERLGATDLLARRVAAWNAHARPAGLTYPRYDGGFFVTVTSVDPQRHAAALRERGVFVVPVAGALRVALCSVATRDVEKLVREMAAVLTSPASA
jgi:aromatic-amino-acid transaminase